MLNQIDRVRKMEGLLNEATEVIDKISEKVETNQIPADIINEFNMIQDKIATLQNYYEGKEWMEDYDADCENLFPPCLNRGVLSEDAIYDLLVDNDLLKEELENTKNFLD